MAKKKAPAKELGQSIGVEPKSEESLKYETDNHMRTLSDAFDIMGDPEKMKRVHALAGRRHKAIKSLSELKAVAHAKRSGADKEDAADQGADEAME